MASGHVPPDAVPDDLRTRDLVRKITALDLTDEQYILLTEVLEAMSAAPTSVDASEPA